MTLDEAKAQAVKKMICRQSHVPFLRLINTIYADFKLELEAEYQRGRAKILALETVNTDLHLEVIKFESRSCEGCKWLMFCGIKKTLDTNHAVALPEFSCNRWELK